MAFFALDMPLIWNESFPDWSFTFKGKIYVLVWMAKEDVIEEFYNNILRCWLLDISKI